MSPFRTNVLRLLGAGLFVSLATAGVAREPALPEISAAKGPVLRDFADIRLAVRSIECDDRNQCSVLARGVYQGKTVGVKVVFGARQGSRSGIAYQSIGAESDALLGALSTLYGQPLPSAKFAARAYGDVVVLRGNLSEVGTYPMQAKVFFFADGPESRYAELYTNIDVTRGVLEIREKDMSYRANVLAALAR